MKKVVTAATTGGAPLYKSDLREVFNDEIWDAIESLLAQYNTDAAPVIISGCTFTANVGTPANFDMTAGIIYIDGEFKRIDAVTNISFTKYIASAAATQDSRTYGDGTNNAFIETKKAEFVSSAPGAGQYVTVSSLSSASYRRLTPQGWSNMTLTNGWASVVGATAQHRYNRIEGKVEFRGQINAAASSSAEFVALATLPGSLRYDDMRLPIMRNDSTLATLRISTTAVQISGAGAYNVANTYDLTGIVYPTLLP